LHGLRRLRVVLPRGFGPQRIERDLRLEATGSTDNSVSGV
jgi:hypothetical protein